MAAVRSVFGGSVCPGSRGCLIRRRPCLSEASETWTALLQPFSHRGKVNWMDRTSPGPVFSVDDRSRQRGPLVTITSVGWTIDDAFDPARPAELLRQLNLSVTLWSPWMDCNRSRCSTSRTLPMTRVTLTVGERTPLCVPSPIDQGITRCSWIAIGAHHWLIGLRSLGSGYSNPMVPGMDRIHSNGESSLACIRHWWATELLMTLAAVMARLCPLALPAVSG